MLDVLLVWIVLAGQMWVYYRLNPGLAVHFSQQSPGFWNSGPLLLCVCFFFVEIASHILPTHPCKKFRCKSKWRSRLCASLQFQWICVTNQLSWLTHWHNLLEWNGVLRSALKHQRRRQSRGCGVVKLNYESNDKSDSNKNFIGAVWTRCRWTSSKFRIFF